MTDNKQKHNPTKALLKQLFNTPNLNTFMDSNKDSMTVPPFHTFISEICRTKGEIPEHIIIKSGIDRTYGHQLFNGTRNPSRDKVLQLAIGLNLDFEETQKLLQIAEKSLLYPKVKRDAALIHCIQNNKEINETQEVLNKLGLTPLGE